MREWCTHNASGDYAAGAGGSSPLSGRPKISSRADFGLSRAALDRVSVAPFLRLEIDSLDESYDHARRHSTIGHHRDFFIQGSPS